MPQDLPLTSLDDSLVYESLRLLRRLLAREPRTRISFRYCVFRHIHYHDSVFMHTSFHYFVFQEHQLPRRSLQAHQLPVFTGVESVGR